MDFSQPDNLAFWPVVLFKCWWLDESCDYGNFEVPVGPAYLDKCRLVLKISSGKMDSVPIWLISGGSITDTNSGDLKINLRFFFLAHVIFYLVESEAWSLFLT